MKIKHFVSLILVGLIMLSVYSCSKSNTSSDQTPPAGASISITGMSFPATTTVTKGSTVTWTNNDSRAHTVTSNDGATFSSGNLPAGGTFSFKANTIGSFAYHCNYHSGMIGTLVVNP